jgi:hypothetical protein
MAFISWAWLTPFHDALVPECLEPMASAGQRNSRLLLRFGQVQTGPRVRLKVSGRHNELRVIASWFAWRPYNAMILL